MEDWRESAEAGDFPLLSPQWRCTPSGRSRGHQGPLCAGYHQVVSDGAAGLPLSGEGTGRGGGEEERVHERRRLECSQKRQKERKRKRLFERDVSCIICACLTGAPQEECALLR